MVCMAENEFDKAKADRFMAWVNSKAPGPIRCSVCGRDDWSVGDKVFELREFHEGNLALGTPIIPVFPLMCSTCGHTLLFNGLFAGLIEQPDEVEPLGEVPASEDEK